MTSIGLVIKHLREQNGLTQEELGRLAGVRQGTISMIECGLSQPSWRLAQKLADLFGMTLPELISHPIEPATENVLETA